MSTNARLDVRLDSDLMSAIRANIRTTLHDYRAKEQEYRYKARYATNAAERQRAIAETENYRRLVGELMTNILNVSQSVRTPPVAHTANIPSQQKPKPIPIPTGLNLSNDIPRDFLCPITMEIMTDPVILTDGQVYQRDAIEAWLKTHNTSPVTKQQVERHIITPCFVLRNMIQTYLDNLQKPSVIANANITAQIDIPNISATQKDTKIEQKKNPKTTKTQKAQKAPKAKREPTEYNLYVQQRIPILQQEHQDMPTKDIMKLIGAEWSALKVCV